MKARDLRKPRDVGGGASSSSPADFVVEFAKVKSSSLAEGSGAVQWSIEGVPGLDLSNPNSPTVTIDEGEGIEDGEQFTALGIIGRPLPPEVTDGVDEFAEVACIKTVDGLVPISARDTRLKMQGNGPAEGTLAFIGYGGGFHSLSPVDNGDSGTIHVIYCPYDFDSDGVAQKAHAITLDPTSGNESISIVHAEGMAVLMNDDKLTLKSKDGSGFIEISDGAIVLGGDVTISGGLSIAADGTPVAFPVALVGAQPNTPLVGGPSIVATSTK